MFTSLNKCLLVLYIYICVCAYVAVLLNEKCVECWKQYYLQGQVRSNYFNDWVKIGQDINIFL